MTGGQRISDRRRPQNALIGETVDIRVTRDFVEVFFHGSRVAKHPRDHVRRRDPIILPEHMPEKHRQYLAYTSEDFLSWSAGIGPNTEKVVRFFLNAGKNPKQGFKSCVSLRKYAETYNGKRIEDACERILTLPGTPSILGISTLLKAPVKEMPKPQPHTRRSHGITRGASQFREGGDEQ